MKTINLSRKVKSDLATQYDEMDLIFNNYYYFKSFGFGL